MACRIPFLIMILFWFLPITKSRAQCSDWNISAQVITGSNCAAGGAFSVTVSGTDAANLSHIQYGIPLQPNGFSVPLNNSALFQNIASGSYQVSAIAQCGGSYAGKNTWVQIPGSYKAPSLDLALNRNSLNCGAYGKLTAATDNNRPPNTFHILSGPAAYNGPASFTSSGNTYTFQNLPAGTYTIQAVDACGSGTVPQSISMSSLTPSSIPLAFSLPYNTDCDTIRIPKPILSLNSTWMNFLNDTLFKVSAQVSGIQPSQTAFEYFDQNLFRIPLPPGKSLKDCYGKSIIYTVQPPCGGSFQQSETVPFPLVRSYITQNCNVDFKANVLLEGLICYPVSYTIKDIASGTVYGPFTASGSPFSTPDLPFGSYLLQYITGDGYSGVGNLGSALPNGNPYQVTVLDGSDGLHNYIGGFLFSASSNIAGPKKIELFNGPAGYSYVNNYWNSSSISVFQNQTPSGPGTLFFPTGNYVWKITDTCGVYYVPVTAGAEHLYQFTAGVLKQKQTCQGLWIWPSGSAVHNGQSRPVKFSFLKNGKPLTGQSPFWPQYSPGDSVLFTEPGIYTVIPASSNTPLFIQQEPYPNLYTKTYSFTYSLNPVKVDMNQTQGFVCRNAGQGAARIFSAGKDGVPFSGNIYKYYLADSGKGITGPYLATSQTGVFSGFGGNAGDVFDIKIEDSCGGFAVQRINILDLQTARLVSASSYSACSGDSLQLSAAYFPNATYSWTGPNGFASSLRNPVIYNLGPQNIGAYYVTVSSTACMQAMTDSTIIALNANPPKPQLYLDCSPPGSLTIQSADTGLYYYWSFTFANSAFQSYFPAEPPYSLPVDYFSDYNLWVTVMDSTTGCMNVSDSFYFASGSGGISKVEIYSPHLQLCPGDTTILVASKNALRYQWYFNGGAIPGATSKSYVTATPGNYKVWIEIDSCLKETSGEITVRLVGLPSAQISANKNEICPGDTVIIQAVAGTGWTYTWLKDGATIPFFSGHTLYATEGGSYSLVVSNGGCAAGSDTLQINMLPGPQVHLFPESVQQICPGDTVFFETYFDASYTYAWHLNGNPVPGATGNTLEATQDGTYKVIVGNAFCPSVASEEVWVKNLPSSINLGEDTTVCQMPFSKTFMVSPEFSNVVWSTGAENTWVMEAKEPGIYWVEAQNPCGTFRDTVLILTDEDYLPGLPEDTLICNGEGYGLVFVNQRLENLRWNTGDTGRTLRVSEPGLYWVEGESPCSIHRDTVEVNFCAPEIEGLYLSSETICAGNCITPRAGFRNYPQQFDWYFEGGSPESFSGARPPQVCYAAPGLYPIKISVSSAGGSDSAYARILVLPQPEGRFEDTVFSVAYKTLLSLSSCGPADEADWYLNDSLICRNCPVLQTEVKNWQSVYTCVLKNADCTDTCTYKITVTDIPTDVFLPTAFSPNSDGLNDRFRVITDNPNIWIVDLSVYNRWGQRIWVSNDTDGWNGSFNGVPAEQGIYFWTLRYRVFGNPEFFQKKGDVMLLR